MARLIDCLELTVAPALDDYEYQTIGNKVVVKLDDVRRIELSLETCGIHDNYELLLMKLTSKTHGELNRNGLKFKDYLGPRKLVSEDFNGGYKWYGTDSRDYKKICQGVSDYIKTWE